MEKIHPRAAGIDLGSRQVYVSVPDQPVRHYATFTEDLAQLVAFLVEQRVNTVAMEATGVYWIVLYDLLEAAGLEVCLVNGAHVRNVPGRKSDVSDCQWLQQLHSCGLLHASFVPPQEVRVLRSYRRLREDHIERAADSVRHMQKALDLMNIKLHTVVSQLSGASGMRIIDAILAGQRDAVTLTQLCDAQILKTKSAAVERSLRGNWKPEQLFALGQARRAWQFRHQAAATHRRDRSHPHSRLHRPHLFTTGGRDRAGFKPLGHQRPLHFLVGTGAEPASIRPEPEAAPRQEKDPGRANLPPHGPIHRPEQTPGPGRILSPHPGPPRRPGGHRRHRPQTRRALLSTHAPRQNLCRRRLGRLRKILSTRPTPKTPEERRPPRLFSPASTRIRGRFMRSGGESQDRFFLEVHPSRSREI
jgi:hypothetical protein